MMTVQQLIDALTALGPDVGSLPVILRGDGVFEAEVQNVMQEGEQVVVESDG